MYATLSPLVRIANTPFLDVSLRKNARVLVASILKKATAASMDRLMRSDYLAAILGENPLSFRRQFLSGASLSDEANRTKEFNQVVMRLAGGDPKKVDKKAITAAEAELGYPAPELWSKMRKGNALDFIGTFFMPNETGLYNALYGGASAGLANSWKPHYADHVPGIRGASPDDIAAVMVMGGLPLPGDIWDNTQKKFKDRPPLYPVGESIITKLAPARPGLKKLVSQLGKSAQNIARKWVKSIDQGYKAQFLGPEVIAEIFEDADPLEPEDLLEFDGWFNRTVPNWLWNLRNNSFQLKVVEVAMKMKEEGRDPFIFRGGSSADVGLRVKNVREYMEENGIVGESGNVPSAPRVAKAWKGAKKALIQSFDEVFASVQQELKDEEEKAKIDLLYKHTREEDIKERVKSLRTQVLQDFREEQSTRRWKKRGSGSDMREDRAIDRAIESVLFKYGTMIGGAISGNPTTKDLTRIQDTIRKAMKKSIMSQLGKVGGKAGDFKVGDIVRHTGKFLRNTGMQVGAPIDGKVVDVAETGFFKGHPTVRWSNGGVESVVRAENIQHARGKSASRIFLSFDRRDLDILAGEIVGYSYDGDGPEPGIKGLKYLAQDDGAIWRAAEDAGFESDDPALEHFMELDNRERLRLLKNNS